MGVLACDRNGCGNIMCDYVSYTYGYICQECLYELKENPNINIREFMDNDYKDERPVVIQQAWESMLDVEFKERR